MTDLAAWEQGETEMRKVVALMGAAAVAAVVVGVSAAYASTGEHAAPAAPKVSTSGSVNAGDDSQARTDDGSQDGMHHASPAPTAHHEDDADEHASPTPSRAGGDDERADDGTEPHGSPRPSASQEPRDR